ncbi:MAG: DNA methyltransferase [Promethearchaeota archaeon]
MSKREKNLPTNKNMHLNYMYKLINSKKHILLPKTHTPMYLMHKYWARKPYNIISHYIKENTKPNDIVLDPFCGSGVTISESILLGRNAIGIDLNPFAIFLTESTILDADIPLLKICFEIICEKLQKFASMFYSIRCPLCGNESAIISHEIWKNQKLEEKNKKNELNETIIAMKSTNNKTIDSVKKDNYSFLQEYLLEIRINCNNCKISNYILKKDKFREIFEEEIKRVIWINQNFSKLLKEYNIHLPKISFIYKSGNKFRQLRHFLIRQPSYFELFTKRNLIILGFLKKIIDELDIKAITSIETLSSLKLNGNKEKDKLNKLKIKKRFATINKLLNVTFTASLGQSSKMVWVISKRNNQQIKKKEVGSWTHHFFWNPTEYFEINPLICFANRFKKTVRAKLDYKKRLKENTSKEPIVFKNADEFFRYNNFDNNGLNHLKVLLLNKSSEKLPLPEESVDFIFTDPPYGDSIQYFELSTIWNKWLEFKIDKYEEQEIVINKRQNKTEEKYYNALKRVFTECYRVLKKGRQMVITFHNSDIKIRNKLISSVLDSGFYLENLIFQIPARASLKSYLHYENSPVGDYYIWFKKPLINNFRNKDSTEIKKDIFKFNNSNNLNKLKSVNEKDPLFWTKLKEIIRQFFVFIIKERGEPVFGGLLFNFLEEYLAKLGLFPIKNTKKLNKIIQELKWDDCFIFCKESNKWFLAKCSYENAKINMENMKNTKTPLKLRIKEFLIETMKKEKLSILNYAELYNLICAEFKGILTPDRRDVSKLIYEISLQNKESKKTIAK